MMLTVGSGDWFGVLAALCKGFAPHFELFSRWLRAERVAFLRTAQNAVAPSSLFLRSFSHYLDVMLPA
jgi:hypothetical protein